MNTDIQFLNDLHSDFVRLSAQATQSPTVADPVQRQADSRLGLIRVRFIAMAAVAFLVGIVAVFWSSTTTSNPTAIHNPIPNTGPVASPVIGRMGPYRIPLRKASLAEAISAAAFPVPIPNAPAANPGSLSAVFVPKNPDQAGTEVVLSYDTTHILLYITKVPSVWKHPERLLMLLVTKKGVPRRDVIHLPSGPALATPTHIQVVVQGALVDITSTRSTSFDALRAVAASLKAHDGPGD
jgi:hypothetical protein